MGKFNHIVFRTAELLLFFFSFGMLVPPVPSDHHAAYSITPTLILGGGAFALSLILAVVRKAESWPFAALKLLFYLALAWVILERVFVVR